MEHCSTLESSIPEGKFEFNQVNNSWRDAWYAFPAEVALLLLSMDFFFSFFWGKHFFCPFCLAFFSLWEFNIVGCFFGVFEVFLKNAEEHTKRKKLNKADKKKKPDTQKKKERINNKKGIIKIFFHLLTLQVFLHFFRVFLSLFFFIYRN